MKLDSVLNLLIKIFQVFPVAVPETLTHVAVWKRFHEVKQLYKYVKSRHSALKLRGSVPDIKNNSYFKRFHPDTISRRKLFILELLDFISQHPALYKSHTFQLFFEQGQNVDANEPNLVKIQVPSSWTQANAATEPVNIVGHEREALNDFVNSSLSSEQSSSPSLHSNNVTPDRDSDIKQTDLKNDDNIEYYYGGYCGRTQDSTYLDRMGMATGIAGRERSILGCRRELKELGKIKVLQLIGNVMQVQDVSNNHIYIMKVRNLLSFQFQLEFITNEIINFLFYKGRRERYFRIRFVLLPENHSIYG